MQCPRCLERNENYFFSGSKGIYCRKCIQFKRFLMEQEIKEEGKTYLGVDAEYRLSFQLTPDQMKCSRQLCFALEQESVLVHAVCGAGKTEIIMESIKRYLKKGLRVGIAIPRRQVVLELAERLQRAFPSISVVPVCQGYTKNTIGTLIVCTTHQLFRYYQYFDLLIVDEPDAYPYAGNAVLQGIVQTSCIGRLVYLTATPDEELLKLKTIQLFRRPHGFPLVEPNMKIAPKIVLLLLLRKWINTQSYSLIFVPTIRLAERLSHFFNYPVIHSKTINKEEVIEQFRSKKTKHLFCTSILERGVTFENVAVCIYLADHLVFTIASLIQILGRVGRSIHYPTGDALLLCSKRTEKVEQCCKMIQEMNV